MIGLIVPFDQAFGHSNIGHMHDQGVKAWPPFRLVNLGNGQIITGIRPQAEYRFGGKGNQPPFGQNLGGFFDVVLG